MFNDIFIFIAIVEMGSLVGAAKKLGMSQATVSRRLQALEDELSLKLIIRNTRNFELTAIGKELYDGVKDQQEHLNNFVKNLSDNSKKSVGKLRVSLPTTLAYDIITPHLPGFIQTHREAILEVCYQHPSQEVCYQQHPINLFKERFDLAIVNYRPTQQTLKIRHLYKIEIQLYCTPEYAASYGIPKTPEELNQHIYPGFLDHDYQALKTVELTNLKTGKTIPRTTTARIFHNSSLHAKPMVLSHQTIVSGWDMLFAQELKHGKIIKVLPSYSFGEIPFYLVRLQEHNTQLVKDFISFIDKCFNLIMNKD